MRVALEGIAALELEHLNQLPADACNMLIIASTHNYRCPHEPSQWWMKLGVLGVSTAMGHNVTTAELILPCVMRGKMLPRRDRQTKTQTDRDRDCRQRPRDRHREIDRETGRE